MEELVIRNLRKERKTIGAGEYRRIIIKNCRNSTIIIKATVKVIDQVRVEDSDLKELRVLTETPITIKNSKIELGIIVDLKKPKILEEEKLF